jgi:hypothetical protein
MLTVCHRILLVVVFLPLLSAGSAAATLPDRYFELMQTGIVPVEERLAKPPAPTLQDLEAQRGWGHFPHALLVAAVLYSKPNPSNSRYRDPKMLALAKQIGDIVAESNEKGIFTQRLDHHRDLYAWLEAYRILEKDLERERRNRWRKELEKNLAALAVDVASRADFAAYNSPFIGTSPNHYSLWSSTLYLGGKVFANKEWFTLGERVMRRFAAEEQAPDGYWGEHDITGPTMGYDYLTLTGVALYWEYSKDPAAVEALRRSTKFHKFFAFPDGRPVDVLNDRNRYWEVPAWGHFAFSNFSDGRRYAEFLTSFFKQDHMAMESLGRIAQNALYYHAGPLQPIPLDQVNYMRRLRVTAGIRKTGPWVVCLSGIIATQAPTNQFYLDRQGNVSVFHQKLGLIITGANSKRQPELATFWEKIQGQVFYMPQVTRLRMGSDQDRLSLAYNSFFSDLYVPVPKGKELELRFLVTPKGAREDAELNLQLCLKAGQILETGAGKKVILSDDKVEFGSAELNGWIRHAGWTLKLGPQARLVWPVRPFNPYADAPERSLQHAVGLVSVPVTAKRPSGEPLGAGVQEISFTVVED